MQLYDFKIDTVPSNDRDIWIRSESYSLAVMQAKLAGLVCTDDHITLLECRDASHLPFRYEFKKAGALEPIAVVFATDFLGAFEEATTLRGEFIYLSGIYRISGDEEDVPCNIEDEECACDQQNMTLNVSVDIDSDVHFTDVADAISELGGVLQALGKVSVSINQYE